MNSIFFFQNGTLENLTLYWINVDFYLTLWIHNLCGCTYFVFFPLLVKFFLIEIP